jgi:hypothetical protein
MRLLPGVLRAKIATILAEWNEEVYAAYKNQT